MSKEYSWCSLAELKLEAIHCGLVSFRTISKTVAQLAQNCFAQLAKQLNPNKLPNIFDPYVPL